MNRHFSNEKVQMFNTLSQYANANKTTLKFYLSPVRMAILKKTSAGEGSGEWERNSSLLLVGM
jgi:hypothetical protein